MGGQTYSEHSHNCPYCASDIEDSKSKIKKISEEFDAKAIEHLINMLDVFGSLSEYFSPETNAQLDLVSSNVEGLSNEQITYLTDIKNEVEIIKTRLDNIKNISFETLKDVEHIASEIESYKLEPSSLVHLNSTGVISKITEINTRIDEVLKEAWKIQAEVGQQNQMICAAVIKYEKEINDFLLYAGYKYQVGLKEATDGKIKLMMSHVNLKNDPIANARQHLSFGERNAFALVLFMYNAINNNPDLIILDDPISSFDGNKPDNLLKMYELSSNNYEKLQIYRMIKDIKNDDDVMQKFINETYHVENDYIFQLNPINYEVIPEYIIDECDKSLGLR
jgi:ABC-type dipeptide/oligopeptide/nickel transport system ATPase subunit